MSCWLPSARNPINVLRLGNPSLFVRSQRPTKKLPSVRYAPLFDVKLHALTTIRIPVARPITGSD